MITKFKQFEASHFHTMNDIDEILDKINDTGIESLDPSEMLILVNYSKDDEYIHKVLIDANDTAKELKKYDRLLRVITKNDTKELEKVSNILNNLYVKMRMYNDTLAHIFKIKDPNDIKTYLQKTGIDDDLRTMTEPTN